MKEVTPEDIKKILYHYGFCEIGCNSDWFLRFADWYEKSYPDKFKDYSAKFDEYFQNFNLVRVYGTNVKKKRERMAEDMVRDLCEELGSKYYSVIAEFANQDIVAASNIISMIPVEEVNQKEVDEEIAEFCAKIQACEKFDFENLTWIEDQAKNLRKKIEKLIESE